jgi:hypothetical protein
MSTWHLNVTYGNFRDTVRKKVSSEKGYSYADKWWEWDRIWGTGVSLSPLEGKLCVNILHIPKDIVAILSLLVN